MKKKSQDREVKYPANKDIARKLRSGDMVTIAKYAGVRPGSVRDMMYGFRRITDPTARAIIRLFNERREIEQALEEIAKQ